ncbi:MAG: hypothetical protein HY721_33760 [Planctomycetes bacterium]|nr:hypothetical protein [Planctomycetota bacterium]
MRAEVRRACSSSASAVLALAGLVLGWRRRRRTRGVKV